MEVARDKICQLAGLVDALEDSLGGVTGQAGTFGKLDGTLSDLAMKCYEGGILRALRQDLVSLGDRGDELVVLDLVAHGNASAESREQELGAREAALFLIDGSDGAGGVEVLLGYLVLVVTLQYREEELLGLLKGAFDRPHAARASGQDGHGDARENHEVTDWEHREAQGGGVGTRQGLGPVDGVVRGGLRYGVRLLVVHIV
jgi:hypothetical protein